MSSANHANQSVEPRRRWAAGCRRRRQSLNSSCRGSIVARAKNRRRRCDPRCLKRRTPGRAFVRARHSIVIPFSHKFARRQGGKNGSAKGWTNARQSDIWRAKSNSVGEHTWRYLLQFLDGARNTHHERWSLRLRDDRLSEFNAPLQLIGTTIAGSNIELRFRRTEGKLGDAHSLRRIAQNTEWRNASISSRRRAFTTAQPLP